MACPTPWARPSIWGLPYLFGRMYFGTPEDLRYFAIGMAVGGLAYVPPCIWESRMSPQLLQQVYGYSNGWGCGWAAIARTSSSGPGWSAGCG